MVKLFEVGEYKYEDHAKPIRYSEEFLRKIAEDYPRIVLQSSHDESEVGKVENIKFIDGWLVGDISDDIALKGKGLSPLFSSYLLDKGEYYEAMDGELKHIALADNPRNQLLYNEIKKDDKMGDDKGIEDVLANRVKELERELAVANNKLESNNKKLESYNELEKEVKELRKSNSDYEKQIESNKDKANKWDEYVTDKKSKLLDEVAGDDSAKREQLKSWDIDHLEFLLTEKNVSTDPKGVGTGNAEGLDEPNTGQEDATAKQEQDLQKVTEMFSELKEE